LQKVAEAITHEELQEMSETINHSHLHEKIQHSGVKIKKTFYGRQVMEKSPSVWSYRDHSCEACGKTLTQSHGLHAHKKYHCKK